MQKKEIIFSLIFFVFVFLVLSWVLYFYNIGSQYGDTTFAAQILENFKRGNFTVSTSFNDSIGESMKLIWYRSAEYVCRQPLTVKPNSGPWSHYYFIMFALTPLTWIFNIYVLIALLQSFIYTSVLAFTYYFALNKKIEIINSVLITLLVSQHPLWQYGLFGQFYFNRFFLLFSALMIWQMTRKKINYFWLAIIIVFSLSTNEIYGIPTFFILTGYGLLLNKKGTKNLLILAVLSVLYSLVSLIIIQSTIGQYATQTGFISKTISPNIIATTNNLFHNAWSQKTLIFLIVNFGFLGVLTFPSFKIFLFTLVFLLPNLLVNIGGAEKTGWATHYHINYFIPLIWLSIIGFTNFKFRKKKYLFTLILLIVFVFSSLINPDNLQIRKRPHFEVKNLLNYLSYYINQKDNIISFRNRLRSAIGDDNSVSAPEAIAYNLLDHQIYYYPMNIDKVDKVIFRYYPEKSGDEKFISINYGHQDDKLDQCIRERMKKNGFDFDKPVIIDGWAVIGKRLQ